MSTMPTTLVTYYLGVPLEERMIEVADGVELCTQAFGETSDPAIVLLAGAACSMDFWPDELCRRLTVGGRYVVRYDMRDTGRSTTWPVGEPGYDGADLVADVVAVLDGYGVDTAHLLGMSLGGSTALRVALAHPERARALTLIASTPGGDDLPGPSDRLSDAFDAPEPDWDDRDAVVASIVEGERPFAGADTFEEQAMRVTAERVVVRSLDLAATYTNPAAVDYGPAVRDRLGEVAVPTLVVHGTDDPMFPLPHGEVLATAIPDARLLTLDGVGHQVPPRVTWHLVVPEVLAHDAVAPAGGTDLGPAAAAMASVVAGVRDEHLTARTPCDDWDVTTLLVHVDALCRDFTLAGRKEASSDVPPDPSEGTLATEWRTSITNGLREMVAAWREAAAWDGTTHVGGVELPGAVCGAVAIDELIVHGWDLAQATRQPYAIDDASVAAARAFVDAVSGEHADRRDPGLFGPEVDPAPDASPLDRLLAATGRVSAGPTHP